MTENSKKGYVDTLHKAVCLEYIKTWVQKTGSPKLNSNWTFKIN